MITRYSMLMTEDDLKVLYRIYDDAQKEIFANIILEYRNNRIYTSLIMFKEIEFEDLTKALEAAREDFISIILIKRKKDEKELTKLLENNIIVP